MSFTNAAVKKAEVKFTAIGKPSFIRITGTSSTLSEDLKVENNKLNGSFDFDLESLTTGLELRDDHMKNEYLHISKFPKAKLIIKDLTIEDNVNFQAMLDLHGVKRAIKVEATIDQDGKTLEIEGKFEVDLSKFDIAIPSFKGITVAKTVKVNVETKVILP